ncbi:MAG: S8 family serine peptidase [Candidatus Nitrosocaldus sp.]
MLRWRLALPAVAISLSILLLLLSLPMYPSSLPLLITSSTTHMYTKVMLEFDSSSTTIAATAKDVESSLLYLKNKGYDIKPIDMLSNVADGAIIYIRSDQVEMLREEEVVKKISIDEPIRIDRSQSQSQPSSSLSSPPFISQTSFEIIGLNRIDGMIMDKQGRALTGEGVKVALIDTGVDYTHKDLYGFGRDGKVIGGYDFLEKDDDPIDVDGHGTAVAGIIAADGEMRGIAPKVKLLAYKIASGSNYTSSLDIVRALERAARDGADIVNISIGMDRVNEDIDNAVNNLVRKGIVVVAAAGNSGQNGMGSPATAKDAITVGATLSTPSSVIAILKINDARFEAIPMLGSAIDGGNGVVTGELVYANFATARDVEGLDLKGKIVLAERGGPLQIVNGVERREVVYFSDKERNVASKGAVALIVYNNEPGAFYGTLIHENNSSDYKARIPVVSISREDGLRIKEMLDKEVTSSIELRIFSKPDLVASFSSRGPASPFYIKPDIVAPGAGINSTSLNGSYEMNSGTSFAAPHVAGTAALLLQKHPDLRPEEVASLLITTAKPVTDLYDEAYPFDTAGAGRLAVDKALSAEFVALPHNLMFYINHGEDNTVSKSIMLRALDSYELDKDSISIQWITNDNAYGKFDVDTDIQMIDGRHAVIHVTVSMIDDDDGSGKANDSRRYEGRLVINSNTNITSLSIPVTIYVNPLAIHARNSDGMLLLSLDGKEDWKSARIKVTDTTSMKSRIVTLTPESGHTGIPVVNRGEYWIDASVITSNGMLKVLSTIDVNSVGKGVVLVETQSLPIREFVIIIGFVGIVIVIAFALNRRHDKINAVTTIATTDNNNNDDDGNYTATTPMGIGTNYGYVDDPTLSTEAIQSRYRDMVSEQSKTGSEQPSIPSHIDDDNNSSRSRNRVVDVDDGDGTQRVSHDDDHDDYYDGDALTRDGNESTKSKYNSGYSDDYNYSMDCNIDDIDKSRMNKEKEKENEREEEQQK